VHFFRRVPLDVVEVVVGDGGHEAGRVAEHGLEVALRGGHEVGVVHEQSRVRPTHADPAIQFSLVADLFTYSYLYIPVKSLNAVGELPLRRDPPDILLRGLVQPRVHDQRLGPLPPATTKSSTTKKTERVSFFLFEHPLTSQERKRRNTISLDKKREEKLTPSILSNRCAPRS
jgi:hypothetical protein